MSNETAAQKRKREQREAAAAKMAEVGQATQPQPNQGDSFTEEELAEQLAAGNVDPGLDVLEEEQARLDDEVAELERVEQAELEEEERELAKPDFDALSFDELAMWIGDRIGTLPDEDQAKLNDPGAVPWMLEPSNMRLVAQAIADDQRLDFVPTAPPLPPDLDLDYDSAPLGDLHAAAARRNLPIEPSYLSISLDDQRRYLRAILLADDDGSPIPTLQGMDITSSTVASPPKVTAGPGATVETPPLPPTPDNGVNEYLGLKVGFWVTVHAADTESIYYGHQGVIDRIDPDADDGHFFIVRFHSGQEDPGDRRPAGFTRDELVKVESR